ncbi:MAG: hypothetical protein ACF8GE_10875 [Phycisphaerales bacterium JB043]
MIWLTPSRVTLATTTLSHVESVSIDRFASRFVEEWSDLGPYQVFADVAHERVVCRVVRAITTDDDSRYSAPALGAQVMLAFETAPTASDARRTSVEITLVIRSVEHTPHPTRGIRQTITGVAISSDGATDPIIESEVTP